MRCAACGDDTIELGSARGKTLVERALMKGIIVDRARPGVVGWWRHLSLGDKLEWIATVGVAVFSAQAFFAGPRTGGSVLWIVPFFVVVFVLSRLVIFAAGIFARIGICLFCLLLALPAGLLSALGLLPRKTGSFMVELASTILHRKRRATLAAAFVEPSGESLAGTLDRATELALFEGQTGDLRFADARVEPFDVIGERGERIRVELDTGDARLALASKPSPRAADDDAPLAATLDWCAKAPSPKALLAPAGHRVRLAGGEWSEMVRPDGAGEGFRDAPRIRVLRGTVENPLSVVIEDETDDAAAARGKE